MFALFESRLLDALANGSLSLFRSFAPEVGGPFMLECILV